jgi:hypothetical protein
MDTGDKIVLAILIGILSVAFLLVIGTYIFNEQTYRCYEIFQYRSAAELHLLCNSSTN